MILLNILGILRPNEKDLEENFDLLTGEAEKMLRAEVHPTTGEYAQMTPIEREAFATAGDRIRAQFAFQIAAAIANPEILVNLAEDAAGPEAKEAFEKGKKIAKMQDAVSKVGKP